jgi:purine-binding chemotaxis protein CheW
MSERRVVVVWTVAGRRYAFAVDAVIEIVRPVWVTPVPEAAAHMLGVIRFRESVVPVFDLRARFDREPPSFVYRNRFIVVRVGERPVAFVVEEVIDVVDVAAADVHGRETFPATPLPAIVAAVLTLQGEVTPLLDVAVAVTASDLASVDAGIEALEAARKDLHR